MKSYPPLIAGAPGEVSSWIHCLRASALLRDAFGALTLKRALDRGGAAEAGDDRVVARVGLSTMEDSDRALEAAHTAQREWAKTSFAHRQAFGAAFHELVRDTADDIVDVLVAEGHPRRLAQWEVAGAIHGSSPETLASNAAMMRSVRWVGQREIRLVRKPDGVVCLSPPQNAAAANTMLGMLVLMAGNALVVKAPRSTPLGVAYVCHEILAPLLERFDAPPGTLSMVCGEPEEILDQWLESPYVDDLMYFGSSARGIEIGHRFAQRGKKPVLELAGNDGVMVWRDAELDLAARALGECFYGSAQICMVPKYVIAHPEIADELIDRLCDVCDGMRPGMPEEPDAVLSPVLKTGEFFTVLEEALQAGAKLVRGGDRMDHDGTPSSSGVFLSPTVLRVDSFELARRLTAVTDETFFPLLPVVVPDDAPGDELLESMLRFVDGNTYGLRNSLWATDPAVVDAFAEQVTNGGLLKINDSHIGFVSGLATHGGNQLSGGVFGETNFPMVRTSHLQGISIATGVTPRASVFDSAAPPVPGAADLARGGVDPVPETPEGTSR